MQNHVRALDDAVVVVDDDPEVRDSLRWLVESARLSVETYGSAEEFLERANLARCGCLVLDVRMPGMSGLALQRELGRRGMAIPTIFITAYADVHMAVRACRAGAVDYMEKPYDDGVLLTRIRAALARARLLAKADVGSTAFSARLLTLTGREREILSHVIAGKTSKEMGADLGVSPRTIEVHRGRLMTKLDVDSVAVLVRRYVQAGDALAGAA